MYLSDQPNIGNELVYWRKAYIIYDWFMGYAKIKNIVNTPNCLKRSNRDAYWPDSDDELCNKCTHKDICVIDYNLQSIEIPQEALKDLLDRCKCVRYGGFDTMAKEFPYRSWSKPIPQEQKEADAKPGTVVVYIRDPDEESNFNDIIESIDKLQELYDTFDWDNKTLYYTAWW